MEKMGRDAFLANLHSACKSLKGFFSARGHDWLASVMSEGADPDVGKLDIDRIYELLCYLALAGDLSKKVELMLEKGQGVNGYRFPYGPGGKKNFAFFRFNRDGQRYDLCCGTGIPSEGDHMEHPDISLQKMPSAESPPEPGDPVAIWDAKYHRKEMSKSDVGQINLWCNVLRLQRVSPGDILEKIMPPQFQVTAVVTNAKENHRMVYQKRSLDGGFSIVFEYSGANTGKGPIPSRKDHIDHRNRNAIPEATDRG